MLHLQGLVIKSTVQGENSRIIKILTKEKGCITATVRGSVKLTSDKLASTQLFAYSNFSLDLKKGWYYVNTAENIRIFYDIRNNLSALALSSYLMQVISECVMENQDSGEILNLTLNCLHFLENGTRDVNLIKSIFEFRFVSEIGMIPDIVACCVCGEYIPKQPILLPTESQICCLSCYSFIKQEIKYAISFDSYLLHPMRYILLMDMKKIFSFKVSEQTAKKLSSLSEKYLLNKLQRSFTALDFYKQICK